MLENLVQKHPFKAYALVFTCALVVMFAFLKFIEPKERVYSQYTVGIIVDEPVVINDIAIEPAKKLERTITTGFGSYTLSDKDVECLIVNAYHEARGEGLDGMVAVSTVVVNRALVGHMNSKTVCSAILKKKQFSWTNNTAKRNAWMKGLNKTELKIVVNAIEKFIGGYSIEGLEKAIYYHERNIKPKWSNNDYKVAVIKNHIFFNPIPPVSHYLRSA